VLRALAHTHGRKACGEALAIMCSCGAQYVCVPHAIHQGHTYYGSDADHCRACGAALSFLPCAAPGCATVVARIDDAWEPAEDQYVYCAVHDPAA